MNVRRITRLLRLFQTLYSGGTFNPDGLAKECSVSRRTVFRDMEALRAAGLPVAFDADKDRYSLPSGFSLPPVNFTAAESLTLLILAFEFGHNDRLPFFDAAHSAAQKLELSFPSGLREKLRKIRRGIHIRTSPPGIDASKRHFYHQIVNARQSGRVLKMSYDGSDTDHPLTTNFRPYQLLYCRHSWYVIGRSSLHSSLKLFNLNRIVELETLDQSFNVPTHFKVEKYLRNAWLLAPEPGPDHDVEIRFSAAVARNVADVKWHKTQAVHFQVDGSLLFQAQVSGLSEIVWWILAYGDQAEVIKPIKLRRIVAQRARNMVSTYYAEANIA